MKVGLVTIGQSPRGDVVREMEEVLGEGVEVMEKGALDGLSLREVERFYPAEGERVLVTQMAGGVEVKLAKRHITPRVQRCIEELEKEQAEIIALLCTGEFEEIGSKARLLRPGEIMRDRVTEMLERGRLGVIVPAAEQIGAAKGKWDLENIELAVRTVSPYAGTEGEFRETAKEMRRCEVDMVVLDCMGFSGRVKEIFEAEVGKPVLWARRVLGEALREAKRREKG